MGQFGGGKVQPGWPYGEESARRVVGQSSLPFDALHSWHSLLHILSNQIGSLCSTPGCR